MNKQMKEFGGKDIVGFLCWMGNTKQEIKEHKRVDIVYAYQPNKNPKRPYVVRMAPGSSFDLYFRYAKPLTLNEVKRFIFEEHHQ